MNDLKKRDNCQESGFAMIGVLIIFAIITVLGLSIVTLSFASVKTSTSEHDYQSAYYIAEAGLTQQMEKVKNEINSIYDNDSVRTEGDFLRIIETIEYDNIIYDDFEEAETYAEISIALIDGTDNQFMMESIGKVGDQVRTVFSSFLVEWKDKYTESDSEPYELPRLTVLTRGNITLDNGPIIGSIGTKSTDKHAITVGDGGESKVRNGEIFVPYIDEFDKNRTCETQPVNEYESHSVTRPEWSDIAPCPNEVEEIWEIPQLPEFPDFSSVAAVTHSNISLGGDDKVEVELKENTKIDNITLVSETSLTFNIGNSNPILVVDNLNINNGHITIKGSGKLKIYVKNDITMGSGSTINMNGEINNLNIFHKGINEVKLSGAQKVYGSLYTENANLKLSGSGGILGNIFSDGEEIEITGGANVETQLILAPKAKVKISGGGSVYGTIMSNSFVHNSGASIIYGEPFVLDGPISPAALSLGNNEDTGEAGGGTNLEETGNSPGIITTPAREK